MSTKVPLSRKAKSFAKSIIADVASLGHSIELRSGGLNHKQSFPGPSVDYREFYREAHVQLHLKRLKEHADKISAFEAEYANSIFIEGSSLNLSAIDPILRPVDLRKSASPSKCDREVVEYLRLYQTIASRASVGRENVFILEDRGHENRVMGALVLASPRFYQPRRDKALGWLTPSQLATKAERTQRRHLKIRLTGLNRMMHVAICCALPPYSYLGAAKLLAIGPFTSLVRENFAARWVSKQNSDPDLAIVTTTTSMGITGTPFQNLRPGKFIDPGNAGLRGGNWNSGGVLYARLGDEVPWERGRRLHAREVFANFRDLISERTRRRAVALMGSTKKELSADQLVNRALHHVGLSPRIFSGNPIGVFVGALDLPSIEAIMRGHARVHRPELSWDMAIQQFRSDFGEATAPTKKPGLDNKARADAIRKRRSRANETTFDDIL